MNKKLSSILFLTVAVSLGLAGFSAAYQPAPDNRDNEYVYLAKKQEDKDLIRQAQETYREALALYKARRFLEAKEKFKELESIFPNYKSTRKYLGRIDQDIKKQQDLSRQQQESEQSKLEKSEQKNKEAEFYREVRQEKIEQRGVPPEKTLNQESTTQPSAAELENIYAHAISLYNHKHWAQARKEFELVLKQDPNYKLAQRYLALVNAKKTLRKSAK